MYFWMAAAEDVESQRSDGIDASRDEEDVSNYS